MRPAMELTGVFPVLPTPFRETDRMVDERDFIAVADFVAGSGAAGAVFPAVASEYQFLSEEERRRLLPLAARALSGRAIFVAGCSAPRLDQVLRHCEHAREIGADVAMVMARPELGESASRLSRAFQEIGKAAPPLILQNAPSPTGMDLSPAQVAEIAAAVPAVRWVKEEGLPSGHKISAILELAGGHLEGVMGGMGGRNLTDELARGACGTMPASEMPDLHSALFRRFAAGDADGAEELFAASLPLLTMQSVFRSRLTKHILRMRGVVRSVGVRADFPEMDKRDGERAAALWEKLRARSAAGVVENPAEEKNNEA